MECTQDRCRAALQLIDFGGEDEVAFGQPVGLVRPGGDLRLPPGQKNVGVMSLLFGLDEGSGPVDRWIAQQFDSVLSGARQVAYLPFVFLSEGR